MSVDPSVQCLLYAKGGAAVISVLTEPKWFKGSISDLRAVRHSLDSMANRPAILLKDFVVDVYQLVEARVNGADTVLLIVAILTVPKLISFLQTSRLLGMEPLVEVANAKEMDIALSCGARLIGVNNRDLHTFTVNTNTTNILAQMITKQEQRSPEDFKIFLCALSGIKNRSDVESYAKCGCEAILVGETLMRAEHPDIVITELLGHAHTAINTSTSHQLSTGEQSTHHRIRSNSVTSIKPVIITPPHTPPPVNSYSPSLSSPSLSPSFQPRSNLSRDLPLPTLTIPDYNTQHTQIGTADNSQMEPPIVKVYNTPGG